MDKDNAAPQESHNIDMKALDAITDKVLAYKPAKKQKLVPKPTPDTPLHQKP